MFQDQYAAYYDLFNSRKNYKEEIKAVFNWAGWPMSVLDIGCGTASYWRYFPEVVKISGIEKSKEMIDLSAYRESIDCADVTKINFSKYKKIDCVTSLFDVLNYLPSLSWINKLPLKKDGVFVFDVLDDKKAKEEGFKKTTNKSKLGAVRYITPKNIEKARVGTKECKKQPFKSTLEIKVVDGEYSFTEDHTLYLWSKEDILDAFGDSFELEEVKYTDRWQTWYKAVKK